MITSSVTSQIRLSGPFYVYIGLIPTGYLHTQTIEKTIAEGLKFCELSRSLEDFGRPEILLKPEIGFVDNKLSPHSYTHPEILRSTILQLLHHSPESEITVLVENNQQLPMERMLKRASGNSERYMSQGYFELENIFKGRVGLIQSDQTRKLTYLLSKEGEKYPNSIIASELYYHSDYSVFCPKLKGNLSSKGLGGAIALAGNTLLEVCNPKMIISDGIISSFGGSSLTGRGQELGLVLVSNNALAHDWVAAQIFNMNPFELPEIRTAWEHGWGPQSQAEIILGGAGLEGLRELTLKGQIWSLSRISSFDHFHKQYKEEFSSSEFPLQVFSDNAQKETEFLDWLMLTYDFPAKRSNIQKWPKASVYLGGSKSYPDFKTVYVIGAEAKRSVAEKISQTHRQMTLPKWFQKRFGAPQKIKWVQLKNGRHHVLIYSDPKPGSSYRDWISTFLFGSLGKMGLHLMKILYFMAKRKTLKRIQIQEVEFPKLPVVMSSRMAQNSWWAESYSLMDQLRSTDDQNDNQTNYSRRAFSQTHLNHT